MSNVQSSNIKYSAIVCQVHSQNHIKFKNNWECACLSSEDGPMTFQSSEFLFTAVEVEFFL